MNKSLQNSIIILGILIVIFILGRSMSVNNKQSMVKIPATDYNFHVEYRWVEGLTLDSLVQDDAGIRYTNSYPFRTSGYMIDKTEVTNAQYKEFLDATGYKPKWPENFLKHWNNGTYPTGKGGIPCIGYL